MNRRIWGIVLAGMVLGSLALSPGAARAQYYQPYYQSYQLNRLYYWPYHFYPHNYWPAMSPQWPESPGAPYQRPPAYMAYPAFKEPGWRHELWQSQRFYRGSHFWLDQF